MSRNKKILNLVVEDDFHLIAIHCSLEAYRVAFLLNKHLVLKLFRERKDIDFQHQEFLAEYPHYRHFDAVNCCGYHLVTNKFKKDFEHAQASGSLFNEQTSLTTHLVPEYKKVDYFLKIEDENETAPIKKIMLGLSKIPEIITAYAIDVKTIKTKQNLIFN